MFRHVMPVVLVITGIAWFYFEGDWRWTAAVFGAAFIFCAVAGSDAVSLLRAGRKDKKMLRDALHFWTVADWLLKPLWLHLDALDERRPDCTEEIRQRAYLYLMDWEFGEYFFWKFNFQRYAFQLERSTVCPLESFAYVQKRMKLSAHGNLSEKASDWLTRVQDIFMMTDCNEEYRWALEWFMNFGLSEEDARAMRDRWFSIPDEPVSPSTMFSREYLEAHPEPLLHKQRQAAARLAA